MIIINPKNLYFSILICAFVLSVLSYTIVHAAQTVPGVQRLEEGIAAYEHGEYDDAVFKLEMAVYQIGEEDKDKLWDTHFYLGLSYFLSGDKDEARKQFIKAQGIINNKSPDSDMHSPKIAKLFKEAIVPLGTIIEMVFIKGGCYEMGDTFGDGEEDEKPVHEVCMVDFYIGKYEVTQGQWEEVMGSNPAKFKNGNNYPVEQVSWDDVQEYIGKLNQKAGSNYRLPTEAEWEYSARSGGKREKWAGTSVESELEQYAWFYNNSGSKTHPVGRKEANGLGLYDMTGNVREWCQDWYNGDAYSKHYRNNPIYMESGFGRVDRGSSWGSFPGYLRSSNRDGNAPVVRSYFLGLRLARTP
jgi:formylglycine-generating enzyme required for sulfatase activity